jgi:hypothetical protein
LDEPVTVAVSPKAEHTQEMMTPNLNRFSCHYDTSLRAS